MFTKRLGNFELKSDVVRLSDPCYDKDTWCAGTVDNVVPGKWQSKIIKLTHEETDWGERVGELIAQHSEYDIRGCEWEKVDVHVGVDSGQAGIFDDSQFKNDMSKPHAPAGNYEYDKRNHKYRLESDISMDSSSLITLLIKKKKTKSDEGMIEFYQRHIENNKKKLKNFDEWYDELQERVEKMYPKENQSTAVFYDVCCDKTLGDIGAGTVEYGVVSSSGFGDGGYDAYVIKNTKNKVVAIKIVFITQEELEPEEMES